MSKTPIDLTQTVMQKIHEKKVVMKPKIYFVLGSVLGMTGLVLSSVVAIFLISLTRFALRSHGPMGQVRLELILSSFPWWAPIVALLSVVFSLRLLRTYDFSYKRNFGIVVVTFVAAIVVAGFVIDALGLDTVWFQRGPMRGIMRQYTQDNGEADPAVLGTQKKHLRRNNLSK